MLSRRKPLATLAVAVLIGLGHPTISLAVDFAPPVRYPVGTSPTGVAVGDFNDDGKPDIAVANSGSGNVSILFGDGDGTFQPAVAFDAGMAHPRFIVAADFDLDGKLDLAVMDSSTGTVVFLGNGDGTFHPAKQTFVPSGGLLLEGDFDGDGKPDLAVVSGREVNLFHGMGNGSFQAGPTITLVVTNGFVISDVHASDINGDGKVDLVVESEGDRKQFCLSGVCTTYPTSQNISLFIGNGDRSFQTEQVVASARIFVQTLHEFSGSQIGAPIVGDFNGDGKVDLAYSNSIFSRSSQPSKFIEINLGHGDGMFSSSIQIPTAITVSATKDLNNDRLSDLISLDTVNNAIVIELNTSPTSGADVGITVAGASAEPAGIGAALTYTANVLNEGPKDTTGVSFTDTLPNGVNFVSATSTQGSCIHSNGIVTCSVGSLASAFGAAVTIVVTPTATGTITNTMSASATDPDLASGNNTATQNTTVLPIFTLTVAKSGSGSGTISSNLPGIDCGSSCSATFLSGTAVLLTATITGSSTFEGWNGACSGTDPNSCTVTLNSDLSVTATFTIPPDFSVSPGATNVTMKRGGQASDTLTFPAQGGFAGSVTLTCFVVGPQPMPTCGIAPASVNVGSSAMLTIDARALTAGLKQPTAFEAAGGLFATWLPLGLLGCVLATGFNKKQPRLWRCLFVMVVAILPAACGGGSGATPPPIAQTYTVTVIATSGAMQHETTIYVTVQ